MSWRGYPGISRDMLGYPFLFMHWIRQFRIQHDTLGRTQSISSLSPMLHSYSPTHRAARPSAGRHLRACRQAAVALAVSRRQQMRLQHSLQVLRALLQLREAFRQEVDRTLDPLHHQVQEALPSSCSFVSKTPGGTICQLF